MLKKRITSGSGHFKFALQPENKDDAVQLYNKILDPEAFDALCLESLIKDPAVKKSWIRALRSGNYPQTKRVLHDAVGYCCLGVLCKINPKVISHTVNSHNFKYEYKGTIESAVLPARLASDIGITVEGTMLIAFELFDTSYYEIVPLTWANDAGLTFDQIADMIEYFL